MPQAAVFLELYAARGTRLRPCRSSVNGADLLAFTASEELVEELHVTPFAAKKILRLRSGFLAGEFPLY